MKKFSLKILNSTIDNYLAIPIFWDVILALIICFISVNHPILIINITDKTNQINLLTNLISTDVSLAGFILAALTIIVTFKSNIQIKGLDDAQNALELIFNSKHYSSIVKVFKHSLIELVMSFSFLLYSWLHSDNFSTVTIFRINNAGMLFTFMSILRALYILFKVLDLDKYKNAD